MAVTFVRFVKRAFSSFFSVSTIGMESANFTFLIVRTWSVGIGGDTLFIVLCGYQMIRELVAGA